MTNREFFIAMREAAATDRAEVIEVGPEVYEVDLRDMVSEKSILVLSSRPDITVNAEGAALPAIMVVGWNGRYAPSFASVFADDVMPCCYSIYQESKRNKSSGVGIGVFLNIRNSLVVGHRAEEHGGIAALKALIDEGRHLSDFGLCTMPQGFVVKAKEPKP